MESRKVERKIAEALGHLAFAVEICLMQARGGRYYVHEHPWSCASWDSDPVQSLLGLPGTILVRLDMCRFNLRDIVDPEKLHQKPTGICTNSLEIAMQLDKRCHHAPEQHAPIVGAGRSKAAAEHTKEFSRVVLKGLRL